MRWRRALHAASCLLLVSAVSGTALAADGPASAPSVAAPTNSAIAAAPLGARDLGRPIFLGWIAAVFLVLGAVVGANDRPDARAEQRY